MTGNILFSHIKSAITDSNQPLNFSKQYSDSAGILQSVRRILLKVLICLPFWVFKGCCFELTGVVTHILNLSLSSSIIPISWKHRIVIPITKVHPPTSFDDLQLISVT
jgi:hypothetical protein